MPTDVQLAPAGPDTKTGDDTVVVELVPSCPAEFKPHAHKVPSDLMATVWDAPTPTAVQLAPTGPDTNTGDDTVVVEFVPSCPTLFNPQAHRVPSDFIATVWLLELSAAICNQDTMLGGFDTSTGDATVTTELFPNCPETLLPQA